MVLCLAVVGGSQALAAPDPDEPADAPKPRVPIDGVGVLENSDLDVRQGREAVARLEQTGTLIEVAEGAGLEPDELREELLGDSSLFLTDTGVLGYADAAPAELSGTASLLPAAPLAASSLEVGALSSLPSSSKVLYLDFDGHTTIDPDWQSVAPGNPATIVSAPFSLDGDPALSPTEQAVIAEAWQRVTEDFLPFDINVTTDEPGPLAGRGQRIVISPTNWTGNSSVLGVASIGSFGANADKPAFVFASTAFGPIAKSIAESVSHEAGHTFGLQHHGQGGLDYYVGHNGWAPIMGQPVSAQPPITQWSKGEYAGASRPTQNDLGVIAARIGYAADNAGGSTCSAVVVGRSRSRRGRSGPPAIATCSLLTSARANCPSPYDLRRVGRLGRTCSPRPPCGPAMERLWRRGRLRDPRHGQRVSRRTSLAVDTSSRWIRSDGSHRSMGSAATARSARTN